MLDIILCFFTSALASFLASVQPGPVNMQVIRISHLHGVRAGMIVAAGGCLPELIYVTLAFLFTFLWVDTQIWSMFSHVFLTIVLATIAIFLFFKSENSDSRKQLANSGNLFFTGFMLGLLNPQLLPFWILTITFFQSMHIVELNTGAQKIAFALGSAFGALIILVILVRITSAFGHFLNNIPWGINKIMSLIFASLAVLELFRFL